jgi:CBS domain-containing protein
MQVENLMNRVVSTCRRDHMLDCSARIMWEQDCGIVPIVDDLLRVVGVITDRDVCMAAYTQGRPIQEIPAWSVMSRNLHTCHADDSIERAEQIMREHRVRRLPVIDGGGRLVGVLSLSDIARHLRLVGTATTRGLDPQEISLTLEAVSQPHPHTTTLGPHTPDHLATR